MKPETVLRVGDQVIVPEGMPLEEAITLLQRQLTYENEVVEITEIVPGCFWDGAYAFLRAMYIEFKWVHAEVVKTMFGDKKPAMHSIASGVGKTVLVPWGTFSVPGIDGTLKTDFQIKDGRYVFCLTASVKRKNEARIRRLGDLTRKLVLEESLYRGKAISIRFFDDENEKIRMPEPAFLDVSGLSVKSLILPESVMSAVESSVFTPIQYSGVCREHGIPLKRGILFEGAYGTGKTLCAFVTAHLCEENGWTFIYVKHAHELAEAVTFAHAYQPAAVFCEDVDRVTAGERGVAMDDILNIVDGIESKRTEIMVVLTTNNVGDIHRAMLRPGRLDAVIAFEAPDAETVAKLIRNYGGDLIEAHTDLSEVADVLKGNIPAVVRECVERAKLSAIKLGRGTSFTLGGAALLDAATGMSAQLKLLQGEAPASSLAERYGLVAMDVIEGAVRKVVNGR